MNPQARYSRGDDEPTAMEAGRVAMNGSSDNSYRHGPGEDCRCIVSPGCLREVRRRQMVPLEAVMEVSGYSREYLSALERGDGDACVVPEVLRVYEQAMGVPVEAEVLTMIGEFLQVMQSGHEMLTRLYWFRVRNVPRGRPS